VGLHDLLAESAPRPHLRCDEQRQRRGDGGREPISADQGSEYAVRPTCGISLPPARAAEASPARGQGLFAEGGRRINDFGAVIQKVEARGLRVSIPKGLAEDGSRRGKALDGAGRRGWRRECKPWLARTGGRGS